MGVSLWPTMPRVLGALHHSPQLAQSVLLPAPRRGRRRGRSHQMVALGIREGMARLPFGTWHGRECTERGRGCANAENV